MEDDFKLRAKKGRLCLAGSLAGSYGTEKGENFAMALIRPRVGFYDSGTISVEKDGAKLQEIVKRIEAGIYDPHIDSVFSFEDLQIAHTKMDQNAFAGKVVIRVEHH